jgi:hypothetical protein
MNVEVSVTCGDFSPQSMTLWDLKPGSPEMVAHIEELMRREDEEEREEARLEELRELGL